MGSPASRTRARDDPSTRGVVHALTRPASGRPGRAQSASAQASRMFRYGRMLVARADSFGPCGPAPTYPNTDISRISAQGGEPTVLIPAESCGWCSSPQLLPDSPALVYGTGSLVMARRLDTGETIRLAEGSDPRNHGLSIPVPMGLLASSAR